MTTPVIEIAIAAEFGFCSDCGTDYDRGSEIGIRSEPGRAHGCPSCVICLDCRTARLNEGDI